MPRKKEIEIVLDTETTGLDYTRERIIEFAAVRLENGKIITSTNNNGGINGGITNGMPIRFNTVVKPTPSIYKKQETVNMATMENELMQIEGRHDPAIIHRARVVVDSMTAIVLADMLTVRFGTDWI